MTKWRFVSDNASCGRSLDARRRFAGCLWSVGIAVLASLDMALDKTRPEDFDAVPDPGGALNADQLRVEKQAQEFVGRIDQTGKPLAVICHGPWLLIASRAAR